MEALLLGTLVAAGLSLGSRASVARAASYFVGVEIELIAEPLRDPSRRERSFHYERFATHLRRCGQAAAADELTESYSKRPEHYDKWWITKDGSLGKPDPPLVPLEAVSPILSSPHGVEGGIDAFWRAYDYVFETPVMSRLCGSHVHVSPSPDKAFSIYQLRSLACGIVVWEDLVLRLLPPDRRHNRYCRPNGEHARALQRLVRNGRGRPSRGLVQVRLSNMYFASDVRDFMQASDAGPKHDRYVLWNFDGVVPGRAGTVEFRGGFGLRSPRETKRWVGFVLAFTHLCLEREALEDFEQPDIRGFWELVLGAAETVGVRRFLPDNWRLMAQQESGIILNYDDSDDEGPIAAKSDFDSDSEVCSTIPNDSDSDSSSAAWSDSD